MVLKLKTLANITTIDELIYPFSMQNVGDVFLHRLKNSIEILKIKREISSRDSRAHIIKVKTEAPTEIPNLPKNEYRIFNNADWNKKNNLMMNANLFPTCTLKNNHYLKARMIQNSQMEDALMAAVTSSGIIEIYRYYFGSHQLVKLPINLSELRIKKYIKKTLTEYDDLVASYNQVAFNNLEICPVHFDNFKLMAVATKSDELIIYRIQDEIALEEFSMNVTDVSKSEMKWTCNANGDHNLFVGTKKGNLLQFKIKLLSSGKIEGVEKVRELQGKLKIPISYILESFHDDKLILLCCKSHSLDIFDVENETVISKYIGVSVTGLECCGEQEFLISTLNSYVYLLKLGVGEALEIKKYHKMDITAQFEEEVTQNSSKMNYYGITTSKNNVLVYVSCCPASSTDHLTVKQPIQLLINVFLNKNPHDLIRENLSHSLNNLADCVEAVRMLGMANLESMVSLEQMDYEIQMNIAFLYYLKVQLMIVNTKIFFYQIRSQNILALYQQSQDHIMELIKVMNSYFLLTELLAVKKCNATQLKAIRAMKSLLINYTLKRIEKQPYKDAFDLLKPNILEIIGECEKVKTKISAEICEFCSEAINENELLCPHQHQIKRCALTNLLIPLDCNNSCSQCFASVTKLDVLRTLFDNPTLYFSCPFCDAHLTFSE